MGRHLSPDEKRKIQGLYEERFDQFGTDVKAVGWGSKESQSLRFEMLTRGLHLKGRSILDVGCGLGDFIPYLDSTVDGEYEYLGVDITPKLIRSAAARYSNRDNVGFRVMDILDEQLCDFDVVVLSGALSYRVKNNLGLAEVMLQSMYKTCNEVVAINFLTSYVDYEEEKNFHYSPEMMFKYGKQLTKYVSLYHDYPLWEFTMQLRKYPIDQS